MVNYFVYAKDYSASTSGSRIYHSNGLRTLDEFKNDVEKIQKEPVEEGKDPAESRIVYLHWGCLCREVDEETTRTAYLKEEGKDMGTVPETIIDWLRENVCDGSNNIKLLYIVTDGFIGHVSVERCFALNENMFYETVVFHAFNDRPDCIDISVATSFFKSRCMTYCNYQLCDNTDISEEYDYDKINIINFESEKDALKSYIKLKFLRKSNRNDRSLQEIDKLKRLRNRLFDEVESSRIQEKKEVDLDTKDRSAFLREFARTNWYKNLLAPDYDPKVAVEKSIGTLINYIVSDSKSFSFDALKFEKKFNKPVEEEPIVDVNFATEQEIAFPDIILDDDKGIPVIILTEMNLLNKIIFHGGKNSTQVAPASFSKFKTTMECPLFLMSDKGVSESIGYFYTLNVYKQFLANNTRTEPRTRRRFHGGLVLTDTEEFDKYNDYILKATYFDSKKLNFNVGLFYYVLWKNCEKKEWMDRNVVERFKEYAMRRISKTVCKIGLSSLPLDPQENTSLLTALWYCVELSSSIFKEDPQNFNHERLRMYHGVAQWMIDILKHFDYELDLKSINKRRELLSYVSTLKKISKQKEKVYYLLERIFKTVDGFLVSEIEKPYNLYILNYLTVNHKEMLRDDVVEAKVRLSRYVHLMNYVGDLEASKAGESTYEICDKTFRPYFAIDENRSFYSELTKCTKKAVITNDHDQSKIQLTFEPTDTLEFNRTMSLYNLYIRCVEDAKKYPTMSEYVDYVSKRKKYHEDLVTIFPSNVYYDIQGVYARYQKVVDKVDVAKFIEVCKRNVQRTERIKTEDRVKFDGDNTIRKFIASEEMKVNLVKTTG